MDSSVRPSIVLIWNDKFIELSKQFSTFAFHFIRVTISWEPKSRYHMSHTWLIDWLIELFIVRYNDINITIALSVNCIFIKALSSPTELIAHKKLARCPKGHRLRFFYWFLYWYQIKDVPILVFCRYADTPILIIADMPIRRYFQL